jgi:hypothetical protein
MRYGGTTTWWQIQTLDVQLHHIYKTCRLGEKCLWQTAEENTWYVLMSLIYATKELDAKLKNVF